MLRMRTCRSRNLKRCKRRRKSIIVRASVIGRGMPVGVLWRPPAIDRYALSLIVVEVPMWPSSQIYASYLPQGKAQA